jgi:phosphonate metabolism protein PhnN/1,5-bisphosphokinase (PRPP-forming)
VPRGTLFLVVGPSGAGKDSLIDGARLALADHAAIVFARRTVTRPADAGGEDHTPATAEEFAALTARGGFMLHWRAHGTRYGIPADYASHLDGGRAVVANVSRTVIAAAAATFAPVRVVEVTAPPGILTARLAGRGRENGTEALSRLARDVALPDGVPVARIDNTGTLDAGIALMLAALRGEA